MRKNSLRKKITMITLSAMLLLAGCGKKNDTTEKANDGAAEEIEEDSSGNNGNPSGDKGSAKNGSDTENGSSGSEESTGEAAVEQTALRSSLGNIPTHLDTKFEYSNTDNSVTIDADITIPELGDSLPLYSFGYMEAKDYDLAALSAKIFDPDSYSLCPNFIYMTKELLAKWVNNVDQILKDTTITDTERAFFENYAYTLELTQTGNLSEEDQEYYAHMDFAAETVGPEHDLSLYPIYAHDSAGANTGIVLGKINGRYWFLEVQQFGDLVNIKLDPANLASALYSFGFGSSGLDEFFPDSVGYSIYNDKLENEIMTHEEAEETAWDIVNTLGCKDFNVSAVYPLEYREITINESGSDRYRVRTGETKYGWAVHFSRHLGNLTLPPKENIDQLFCVIAPEGCIHLEYNNIFTVQEMDEKVTNLLPYDSLLSSIEHSFSDICTKMESEGETGIEYKVDAIVLGCYYQEDENGNHTLVPAWYLFNTYESYYGQLYPVVVINAIDGSLITEYFTGGVG